MMILLRTLPHPVLLLLLAAAPLAAQTSVPAPPAHVHIPGSYTLFGSGCGPGGSQDPRFISRLRASEDPVLGGTIRVEHWIQQPDPCWRGSVFVLLTGLSGSRIGSIPLPLDLGPFGHPGCFLYTSAEVATFAGFQPSLNFRIPNDPSLLGLALYQQWVAGILTGCPTIAWWRQYSNGGRLVIGMR